MADQINITIDSEQLKQKLKLLTNRADNAKDAFAKITQIMASSVEKNFEAQGRYSKPGSWQGGSTPWTALSNATLLNAIGGGKGYTKGGIATGRLRAKSLRTLGKKKILQGSGQLAASIHQHATKSSSSLSTNKKYAAIQNFGGKAGRGKKVEIPARPYMVLQSEDIQDAITIIEQHLTRGLK